MGYIFNVSGRSVRKSKPFVMFDVRNTNVKLPKVRKVRVNPTSGLTRILNLFS
jgi:hypothetical protein